MPIPTPKKGESKNDFVSRCMSDTVMKNDYSEKQRLGVCESAWSQHMKANEGAVKQFKAFVPFPVNEGEQQTDFLMRCVGAEDMSNLFPNDNDRLAACKISWVAQQPASSPPTSQEAPKSFCSGKPGCTCGARPYVAMPATLEGTIKYTTFQGTNYMILPVVAMTQGVRHPVNGVPALSLASVYGNGYQSWDGRPVFANHPRVEGELVAANQPGVLEAQSIGTVFNTRMDDGKLKMEAWINVAAALAKGGDAQVVVEHLQKGGALAVSVGAFMSEKEEKGTYDGQAYQVVWEAFFPDHLAILAPGLDGACSVAAGCGTPRVNEGTMKPKDQKEETVKTLEEGNEGELKANEEAKKSAFRSFFEKVASFMSFTAPQMSDSDVRKLLSSAITSMTGDGYIWIAAVYPESVVYETGGGQLMQRGYTLDGGKVTLATDVVEVRAQVNFVPINQESAMKTAEQIAADEKAKSLEGKEVKKEETPVAAEKKQEEVPVAAAEKKDELKALTTEEYIANAPKELQPVLRAQQDSYNERKAGAIKTLMEVKSNPYSEQELKAMEVKDLERLIKLANVQDYSVRSMAGGAAALAASQNGEDQAPPAPKSLTEAVKQLDAEKKTAAA